MYELKRLDIWSVVKVTFVLSFFLGLMIGVFYLFIMFFVTRLAGTFGGGIETEMMHFGGVVGFFMIFFIAIFTSVFYTAVSAILAGIYNLVSSWIGGVRLRLSVEEVEEGTI